ncbi:putative neuronal acetylcholine receptor subunit beta-2-like isoform X2, partial [Apostichopus japonicus]
IKYFPFDSQVCQLKFNSGNIPAEKMLLKAGVAIMSPALSSSEWNVLAMNGTERIFYEDDVISNRPMLPYSQVRFCLYLKRHPRHYVLLLIIPSTILNLMTIMTFLSPADSGERMSLSVSMILGLTVFQLLVADMLPVTEGRDNPILSNYLTGNFVLSVLAIPCSLYSVNVMCSYDNNVKTRRSLTNQILAGIVHVMHFFGILKKPKKMSAKVTVDEFLRQDSLPCDDVINGRPDERKDKTENRQVHHGLSDGQLHMHKMVHIG